MERLKAPQTHLSLKAMISELDQDGDGKLSFAEVIARPIWRSPREPHAWCFQLLQGACCFSRIGRGRFARLKRRLAVTLRTRYFTFSKTFNYLIAIR